MFVEYFIQKILHLHCLNSTLQNNEKIVHKLAKCIFTPTNLHETLLRTEKHFQTIPSLRFLLSQKNVKRINPTEPTMNTNIMTTSSPGILPMKKGSGGGG